ncbi:10243_t:CDS:1, partial [Ambispora leptoticha]
MIENYRPFRLININSGYFVHSDDEGRGNIRMLNSPNSKCQLFYAEPQDGSGYTLRNLNSGYYVHCDDEGRSNVRQLFSSNDKCQVFYFNNEGRFISRNSGYYIHADDEGRANLRMLRDLNNKCQVFRIEYDSEYPSLDDVTIKSFIKNTQELDDYLINQDTDNRYCGIKDKNWTYLDDGNIRMKPIFSYLKYINKTIIPEKFEQEHTFEKIKGTVKTWNVSVKITQSISANIGVVESNTSIELGFSYTSQISEQTREEWKQKVTGPVTYWTFQPVIVFALQAIKGSSENPAGTKLIHLTKDSPFLVTKYKKGVDPREADIIVT